MELKRNETFYNIARIFTDMYVCSKYKINVSGDENLPREGPALIIPKHQKWDDIPLQGYLFKGYCDRQANWIMKPSLPKLFEMGGGVRIARKKDLRQTSKEKKKESLEVAKRTNIDTMEYIYWLYTQKEIVVLHGEGTLVLGKVGKIYMPVINYTQKIKEEKGLDIPLILVGINYENSNSIRPKVNINIKELDWNTSNLENTIRSELAKLSRLELP